jgi:hypothetical protein
MLVPRPRPLRQLALLGLLATVVAACGAGGGAPAAATPEPAAATVASPAGSTPAGTDPGASAALVLDLPDLSAVEDDLGGLDGDLAADASAPSAEGSDQ